MSKSKQKGTSAETAVNNYLISREIPSHRVVLSGSADKGDLNVMDNLVTVEVKNELKIDLSSYVREAEQESINAGSWIGVAWHHKKGKSHPEDWYVTMSGETFTKILKKLQES
jgi:hypothetical protein